MKDIHWLRTRKIAHRGLHTKDIPENSLEAFLNATKNGYDIEFDLQLSKDNRIVIIHDDNLLRLCGVNEKVSRLTYRELQELNLNNTNSKIPLFTDLLDAIPSSTHLMIELKTGNKNKQLINQFLDVIAKHNFTYVVQSFNPRIVNRLRKIAPDITRGYIEKSKKTRFAIINFLLNLIPVHSWIKPDYYLYKIVDLPNKKMDRLKAKGIPILSYTAKSESDLKMVKDIYDNAVFEGFRP